MEVGVSTGAGFAVEIDTSSLSHDPGAGEELAIVYDPLDLTRAELAAAVGRNAWVGYLPTLMLGGGSLAAGTVVLLVTVRRRSAPLSSGLG